jgi:hypothetical protein
MRKKLFHLYHLDQADPHLLATLYTACASSPADKETKLLAELRTTFKE